MSKEPDIKSATPKTEPAAAHNPFSAFDPMAAWTASQATWQKFVTDSFSRAQAWSEEYASIEAQAYSRALQAVVRSYMEAYRFATGDGNRKADNERTR